MNINLIAQTATNQHLIYLLDASSFLLSEDINAVEKEYIQNEKDNKKDIVLINKYSHQLFFIFIQSEGESYKTKEKARIAASKLFKQLNKSNISQITIVDQLSKPELALAFAEGLLLSGYQFLKYYKNSKDELHSLTQINLVSPQVHANEIRELNTLVDAVFMARTLINEPVSYLTAQKLAEEFKVMGSKAGFHLEVFDMAKIKALKMGGLLAVNRGSMDPPTFSILEWKPEIAKNAKPIILVGKGVVYDSGGLSLKPTLNSMDYMKSDMSGAAAVASILYLCATNMLPLHVIGLVPATDNRPGENAFTPGDVIEMHNGLFVEVLNTDAEGRLILGDALSYAQKYDPLLVIDLATLTGAASVAVGELASVVMGNTPENIENLKNAGLETYERLVELPLWEEYGELIKSDIADIKNSGKRDAGTITAGKFLEHFTDYPWIHLDIASNAFIHKADHYRTQGGVGIGIRLIYQFLKNWK
jgi:leucyl aminopeptidase